MEFLAAVIAIVAIILVFKLRKRVTTLEAQVALLNGRLDAKPEGVPQAAPEILFPEQPAAPEPEAPEPAVSVPQSLPPSAQHGERAIDAVFAAAAQHAAAAPPPETPLPPHPAAPSPGFEERFGASWVVWIGGLALALGGIFMVQFSIEAGLVGPGVRVFLGGLLAAALVTAGEWTRRREFAFPLANVPTAHIPSILTAAGTTVAYATIYAAYALYDFLPAPLAFILLDIVALATLAAALLHGPALAALGQVGAFVSPLLVASNLPNYWALYIYLGVVTAASYFLARARMWRWLVITAVAFGTLWMFPGIADTRVDSASPHA